MRVFVLLNIETYYTNNKNSALYNNLQKAQQYRIQKHIMYE